ncbi:CidA/LrgA family protein [Marinococcus halophilus]|uniref:Holin-like protein CidA n=1 Tax=Marinococcus halophilus TaxID=1371 RepID=A0A510Y863_MARHA|nr:CidA/LrgA family protein [Marinococcus halophilus]OZT79371.1 CidA/LrgA family protein [Marinococcus halophilus]GEK59578.1 holin-like protein CidA [Marinococcus halophilus]
MNVFRIVIHILILYAFYWTGVWIQGVLQLPIPGSILGMLLLLAVFIFTSATPKWIQEGSGLLLGNMPLLFLPVTAGLVIHGELFSVLGAVLVTAVFISTLLVMGTGSWVSQYLLKKRREHRE